jgi:hypothetical protein
MFDEPGPSVPYWRHRKVHEWPGLVLSAISLAVAIWRLRSGTGMSWPRMLVVGWLGASAIFFVVFVVILAASWYRDPRSPLEHPPRHLRRSSRGR